MANDSKWYGFLKFKFIDPLQEFFHDSRAIGIFLLSCTAISLIIANTAFGQSYINFWHLKFPFAASVSLPDSLLHFINDALMAVFFFLVGMEIRKELIDGELSSIKKSLLPVVAAVGGMLFPALIYILFNANTPYAHGWAVPTATDIAFSLGVASLLGKRFPTSLKIFLTALAIIDDLGAIIIIALFYGSGLKLMYLVCAAVLILIGFIISKKIKKPQLLLLIVGLLLWYAMFNSGIHATIAGVIFAFIIPKQHLSGLQLKLHNPVYFFIMPVFALANTAIALSAEAIPALSSSASLGIMLGLFIGKPLGITLTSLALTKTGIARLPQQCNPAQLMGAGMLAGIGFTMSIFISTLAFDSGFTDIAKLAVLIASIASMIIGFLWMRFIKPKQA